MISYQCTPKVHWKLLMQKDDNFDNQVFYITKKVL
jgi:methylphosphotriester-DNA--protein-cysteine methyltransferase